MEDVQFNEDLSLRSSDREHLPTLNKIIVKLGLAKDYKSSNVVLTMFAVFIFALALFVFIYYV